MPYAELSDFERYFERFGTLYYGTMSQSAGTITVDGTAFANDVLASYDRINGMLESIERIPVVPIATSFRTGSYNPFLIEWNVLDTVFTKLKARHTVEFKGHLPEWMLEFGTRCYQILCDISNGKISLDTDTTYRGIGMPIRVVGTVSQARFYSNWNSGFYDASDFEKEFHIKISNVNDGTTVGSARFQISRDGGYSFDTNNEIYTGTNWISIENGLQIRWSPYGSSTQLALNDQWKITCTPLNVNHINSNTRAVRFGLG